MLFGLPAKGEPASCSVCRRTSDEVNVWWPSPVWVGGGQKQDEELKRVKLAAKCEYCMFGVPYVQA